VAAARPETASATAAMTVALQVRKSFAENSSPAISLMYSLMSSERTFFQSLPFRYASSSLPPPRRRLSTSTSA
jgi:hypothetical protein